MKGNISYRAVWEVFNEIKEKFKDNIEYFYRNIKYYFHVDRIVCIKIFVSGSNK